MVCFTRNARRFLPGTLVFLLLFAFGCNYHGRIKRGIYKTPPFDDKIEASVMVPADRFLQQAFTFKDDNLTPINSYTFRIDDGAAVAAADALGTLFSQADVNEYRFRRQYDYIAELDYKVTEENEVYSSLEAEDGFLWARKYRIPKFHTFTVLTLRDPHTRMPLIKLDADRVSYLEFSNTAIGAYWFNKLTFSVLFPLIAPVYTSSAGGSIRQTLEDDLRACLQQMMKELEENRIVFQPGISPALARNDRRYRPFMEKTTYVETPQGHGTGFFISPDGYMITNAHVVSGNRDVRYYLYEDLPFEPRRAEPPFRYARVIKVNDSRDLALLKAEGTFPYFKLDADRSHYQTGDSVFAVGNPMEEFWSVSEGIISAVKDENGVDVIQSDVSTNRGNSGGPLVHKKSGNVIGVTSYGYKNSEAAGLNFSISAFEVKRTLGIDQPIDEKKLLREEILDRPQTPQKANVLYQDGQNYVK
ncbi:S1C family serine protease [Candidatus Avelusimicrobium gallicola]|uniref:Serine protease n=1 Tax=Candidatus Avelusimicrobium gallicola TaxID=2562704 RepID=A0A1Y4DCJ8_9BACT|nr:S1C family serine protease [Elusimicrobium sp. An273]OUO56827.1 hypothetical protein B5F75_02995 [Elusimicrobium sp. An273]